MSRSFPAQRREADGPPPDILPPPVAPPLHAPPPPPVVLPPLEAQPQVAAFVDQRIEVPPPAPAAPRRVAYAPAPTDTLQPPVRPTVQPMVVKFPTSVRLRAGMGLLVYVTLTGLALGAAVLLVAGLVAKAAGQI